MNTTDVLLIFANPILFPSVQPYGIMILSSALNEAGIRSRVFLPFMEKKPAAILAKILEIAEPKIVGFSFRNLDTAGFHYEDDGEETFLPDLVELITQCRRNGIVTVVGGAGFSIAPGEILEVSGADVGFVGPSEKNFTIFCTRILKEKASINDAIRGLTSAFSRGQIAPSVSNDGLLTSYGFNETALEYAKIVGGTIPVRTKSGCPLHCNYCVVPSIEKLILRPWADIRSELQLIVDYDLQERVFIADGEFNLPSTEHAIELCNLIRQEFGDIIKWRCYLEPGYVTPQLLQAMVESGCVGISLTVDTFSDPTRRGFSKITKADDAKEVTRLCLNSGIETQINLLFGGPNETLDTVNQTAFTAKLFNNCGAIVAVTIGLRVYPNTPFVKQVKLSRYLPHFHPCKTHKWLGVFCSPIPPKELAHYVMNIIPPSPTIPYTNTIRSHDKKFFNGVAWATKKLVDLNLSKAEQMFVNLQREYPLRKELELGILKVNLARDVLLENKLGQSIL